MNIYEHNEALENVLAGAKAVYEPVKTTLGPKGRNVLIRDKFGKFTITHDGVTVAKSIHLKDDPKVIGAEIIREASRKMDETGDGTTSVTVLTYHLINEAKKLIDAGENPMMIKRKLEAEIEPLVEQIKKQSKKIGKDKSEIEAVATVSVGDPKLGKLVADLMAEIGYEGAVTVETTSAPDVTTKVVEGFTFDRGYMSPYFATDAREAKLKNPAIIVTKGTINELQDYENVLNVLTEQNIRNCLIVAENVEVDALNTFILNKVRGAMNFCVVKAPGMGEAKEDNFKDICAVTGAELIDPSVGDWQNNLGLNTLGAAEEVVVTNDQTVIIGGQGNLVDVRVEALTERIKTAKLDEKDEIKERIARLQGKVGVIKVGGNTDTEAEEKKYRIDDAVAAVKAALKDGIVAGGGVTLRDLSTGNPILMEALKKPYITLLENSGIEVPEDFNTGYGINVLTGEAVDTLKAGIIDPAKVTIEVVRNAITTACLAITVGGAIVDKQLSNDEMMKLMNGGQ